MTNRILTTHVGSLVRPPEVMGYVEAIENGVAVDAHGLRRLPARRDRAKWCAGRPRPASTSSATASSASCAAGRSTCSTASAASRSVTSMRRAAPDATRRCFPSSTPNISRPRSCPSAARRSRSRRSPTRARRRSSATSDLQVRACKLGREGRGRVPARRGAGERGAARKNEYYKSDEEFLFALADALREEYKAIVDAGLYRAGRRRVPALHVRRGVRRPGPCGYRKWAALRVEALNHALEGLPEEKVRYHICWGSFNTPHVSDVPLQATSSISCSR